MNDLSKYLVDQILLEEKSPIKNVVVVYVGRFQPMHKGHHQVYEHLVKKFGRNNVFVGTSNKVQRPKSPFNFKEKREIMTTMFGIPRNKIVEVKNPYAPTEVLKKFNEEETAFVTVVGKKDASRLGGKYFDKWDGKPTHGYKEKGYIYVSPAFGNISGTETRNGLSVGSDEQRKSFFKDRAYGKYNEKIFRMITDKLNEGIEISKETIEDWLISESSKLAVGHVDDGPVFWLPNLDLFGEINVERATKIGYEVVSKILNKELEDYYEHPIYPNGPVPTTTWFPAGVIGDRKNTNVLDIYTNKAYTKWYAHVTRQMALTGYQLVQTQLEKDNLLQDKEDSVQNAQNAKELEKEFENSLDENIKIPVKVGDTILTGRFKNKKVVVKNIGKDEHGMPTINGKKVVTFRLMKEHYIAEIAGTSVDCQMCEHSWDIDEKDPHPYLCHNCGYDNQKLEYDYDEWNKWKESEGIKEQKRVEFYESHFKNLVPSNFSVSKEDNNIKISIPSKITEMSIQNLDKIEKYAEKQLSPEDIEFTRHFFDRLNDPRNGKEISDAELVGFFKRLSRFKKKFKEFLEKYEQIVVKDKRSNINIPFLKQANQIIAKTIMRKSNFKTSNPTLAFEVGVGTGQSGVRMGYPSKDDLKKRMKDVEDQRKKTDSDKEFQYKPIKEDILTEGGAYGHMNHHPFDTDINLTFGDLKDIVNRALEGTLEFTREKTDGQALAISWRDDRGLIAARNKSHLKNQGKGALDINGVSAKFQGRGGLTDAYNFAMKDLTKAISSLSSKQRDKIFKQGSCFMNLEVIWPTSVNVIPYGQALLVFHGTMEYDEDGKLLVKIQKQLEY
jgi:cytidyltransferase-like protein